MPKAFPHISNIHRIQPSYSPVDKIRLHASERVSPYEAEVYNTFLDKISEQDIRLYPDVEQGYEALSRVCNVKRKHLNLYDGSSTGIRHIFQVFGNGKIISADPSFPMYKVYADILGLEYVSCEYNDFDFPYEDILNSIDDNTAIVILSNPSTPFGYDLNDDYVRQIWMKCVCHDCLLVMDEAYIEFSSNQSYECLARMNKNIIVLRTLSKAFGSAGVRIGYSISHESNKLLLDKVRNLNDISSFAIKWIETIDEHYSSFQEYIQLVKANRDGIQYELCNNGYKFIVSNSNFVNVKELELSDEFLYKYFEYNGRTMTRFSIPAVTNDYSLLMEKIRKKI